MLRLVGAETKTTFFLFFTHPIIQKCHNKLSNKHKIYICGARWYITHFIASTLFTPVVSFLKMPNNAPGLCISSTFTFLKKTKQKTLRIWHNKTQNPLFQPKAQKTSLLQLLSAWFLWCDAEKVSVVTCLLKLLHSVDLEADEVCGGQRQS